MFNISDQFLTALQSVHPVKGLTHNFYRYPARFAPEVARQAIREFTEKGDCVLDAFMGGGTTIIEAIASGRFGLGADINPLAYFITNVKTTPLSPCDIDAIHYWLKKINFAEVNNLDFAIQENETQRCFKNVPPQFRECLIHAMSTLDCLSFPRQKRFAKCLLLKLGQWALDCKDDIPSPGRMNEQANEFAEEMLSGLKEFIEAARESGIQRNRITGNKKLYLGSIEQILATRRTIRTVRKPKLLLTSPPYPGIHILYHRWQVHGRRETPLPYWIAGLQDGHGESYYTLGGRSTSGIVNYFERLTSIYRSLSSMLAPDAYIVQIVAFSQPQTHLPQFLNAMDYAGYEEVKVVNKSLYLEHISRNVPHRKWYTYSRQNQNASNEFLLIHRVLNR